MQIIFKQSQISGLMLGGEKPDDADDYIYSQVRVTSYVSGNQPYSMTINSKAVDAETGEEFTPYKYSIGVSGWRTTNVEENSLLFNNTNGREDYVLYRFPKDVYGEKDGFKFLVTNDVTTQGIDMVDSASGPITSTTEIVYKKEPWQVSNGNFITLQNGDNYYRVHSEGLEKWSLVNTKIDKYSRYDLQNFQNGTLTKYDNLDFGQHLYGRPFASTVPSGLPKIPENYFKENVTYTQYVNGIGLVSEDSTVDENLDYNDYQIKNISLYIEYRKGTFSKMSNKFVETPTDASDENNIEVYVKYLNKDNDYIHVADYSPKSGKYTYYRDGLDSVDNKLILDDNAVAYKLVTSNKYAYTKMLSGTEYMLKHSPKVDNFVKNKEEITIQSNIYGDMVDSTGKQVFEYTAPVEYDYARKTETTSKIYKSVTNVKNNRIKKQYELTWEIDVKETAKLDNNSFEYIDQEGGKWFDLMPAGLVLDEDSVKLIDEVTGKELATPYVSGTVNNSYVSYTFYNRKEQTFIASKTVSGTQGNKNELFDFTAKLTTEDDSVYNGEVTIVDKYGKKETLHPNTEGQYEFEMRHGDVMQLSGFSSNIKNVELTEKDNAYITTMTSGNNVVDGKTITVDITGDEIKEIKVNNSLGFDVPTGITLPVCGILLLLVGIGVIYIIRRGDGDN